MPPPGHEKLSDTFQLEIVVVPSAATFAVKVPTKYVPGGAFGICTFCTVIGKEPGAIAWAFRSSEADLPAALKAPSEASSSNSSSCG